MNGVKLKGTMMDAKVNYKLIKKELKMTKLLDLVWDSKFSQQSIDEIIFDKKETIKEYLRVPKSIPSFIFSSRSPGTGKSTLARLIAKELQADLLKINSSVERGIDVIRDKIVLFAQSMASNESKRCVFMEEFDGCTKIAQDGLKDIMEQYSNNCFFIFATNDISKIIDPIRSRCVTIDFSQPPRADIINRLRYICEQESLGASDKDIADLVTYNYPDIRSMVLAL